jgi:hypothetical protein
MSPNEPEPILRPRRYFLPTLSSIILDFEIYNKLQTSIETEQPKMPLVAAANCHKQMRGDDDEWRFKSSPVGVW